MPYQRSYRRQTRRRTQAIVPRRQGALGGIARALPYVGAVVRGVRQGLQMRNQIIAQQNRNVAYRNARKAATKKAPSPTSTRAKVSTSAPEVTWKKFTSGPKRDYFSVRELARLSTFRQVVRWQNVAPIDKGTTERGALWLNPVVTTTDTLSAVIQNPTIETQSWVDNVSTTADLSIGLGYLRCPYHLYLLNQTSIHEKADTGPAYQPFIKLDTGVISFANLYGSVLASGSDIKWGQEFSTNAGAQKIQKYIKQSWYQIKLALRNAVQQTTYFDIWVFKFRDGYLDPLEIPSSEDEIRDRKAFYQGLASSAMRHPIMTDPGFTRVLKKLKMMKKIRIVMDRQQTTDSDASPDVKIVNWFIRDGKMYDYMYSSKPPSDDVANVVTGLGAQNYYTDQGPTPASNKTSPFPKARARVWMMVRAYDSTIQASANSDTNGAYNLMTTNANASYDIVIRKEELARINT